jgi:hypothetical protein
VKKLWNWIVALDRILRGETTRVAGLRDGAIDIPLGGLALVLVLLGMVYGVCMGTYAAFNHHNYMQLVASMVKVPALFVLTLAVTLPSLYVFNALVGSRLTIGALLRLFVAALGVGMAVLASLGPIVAFFSINTTTYSFIVLLNVLIFAISGFLSLGFLLQTLHRISIAPYWTEPTDSRPITPPPETPIADEGISPLPLERQASEVDRGLAEPSQVEPDGPLERLEGHVLGRHTKAVFRCWMILFGLVGAQMGWVLRPFIGSPDVEFAWFRERKGNFFESVWHALQSLFG